MKDVPVAMTTVGNSSTVVSPLRHDLHSKAAIDSGASHGYQRHQELLHPANTYTSLGGPEPSLLGYPPTSVGCNTTDDWEEEAQGKHPRVNQRGARRSYRGGGRWRGSYDPDRRTSRKRCDGEAGPAPSYSHYSASYRGRGRGY